MEILQLNALRKQFGGKKGFCLNNINLSVEEGELLALIGESGSGKTTLLRLIAGFERADKGEIRVKGQEIVSDRKFVSPEKRHLGMVFQDYALFPHLNLYQNISFGLHKQKRAEKEKRVKEMLDLVGLTGFDKRYPHELSGGQQQRVALARALAPRPELLLLDEPFSNLDALLKDQVREEVRQIIKKTRTTAVFVTHDTKDALSTADRIAILKEGEIQQIGTPDELYEKPCNAYVARFFGKINFVKAEPKEDGFLTELGFIPTAEARNWSQPVKLAIRPEHIHLSKSEDLPGQGVIKHINYLGDHLEITLAVKNREFLILAKGKQGFEQGEKLDFELNSEAIWVIPS
ncbi:ABC transporter ATP-binding protein [Xanthovirga aplysinae]|uniref:ABC transporter ATP-binding protein n=1 Tax=Xanthovirga aplysinae TaxID=2529853 RepID=UPI0012BCBC1B|nr:ABC transporter ATP-binding protein [Xanthovirga aplysinae]MTI30676.1 ABC transporter ATP-binding protein [Xanthovirga aplysinae]